MNAVPAEKNVGDPTSKYPDAAEIPSVKMDTMQKPESNPVVDAFETLMQYAQALEQRQDPKAATVKEHLTALVQTIAGGAEAEQQSPEKPTPEKPMAQKPEEPVAQEGEEPVKSGFDPFKDPSEDEPMEGVEKEKMMMAKNRKNRPKNIEPLA